MNSNLVPVIVALAILLLALGSNYFLHATPPIPIPETHTITLHAGERSGSLLVQAIFPNRIEGLNFPDYPIASPNGFPITLHVGETASNGCTVFLKLEKINGNTAEFTQTLREPGQGGCPICLSGKTQIETPSGNVNVKELRVGMRVWTLDAKGNKVETTILRVSQTRVPSDHKVVHLILEDGRALSASPGHPLSNGEWLGNVRVGDVVDGSRVVQADLTAYDEAYTYDLLPAGTSGVYWANGIALKSTLFK